jgi:16S rRNA (guanine966-N2)-methyltransferase
MRIIAGMYRGTKLSAPRALSVRPTTDRVKQTLFDILASRMNFEGADVLDLFAGSGSLGLEALSRGAARVTFVEKSRDSIQALERNIRKLRCQDRSVIHQADVLWFVKNVVQGYDLVFVDPPYALESIGILPSLIAGSALLHPGSFVVMEHSRESVVPVPEAAFDITRKQFGQTVALILLARGAAGKERFA